MPGLEILSYNYNLLLLLTTQNNDQEMLSSIKTRLLDALTIILTAYEYNMDIEEYIPKLISINSLIIASYPSVKFNNKNISIQIDTLLEYDTFINSIKELEDVVLGDKMSTLPLIIHNYKPQKPKIRKKDKNKETNKTFSDICVLL